MSYRKLPANFKRTSSAGSSQEQTPEGEVQWSTQAYSLSDIVEKFVFPRIVQCSTQSIMVRPGYSLPVSLGNPLVLFSKRSVRKLLARNVVFDMRTHRYTETDESIVIPEDFQGTFLKLNTRTMKDASTHRSVESLLKHSVKACINVSPLSVYQLGQSGTESDLIKQDYSPGNVFLIDNIIPLKGKQKASGKKSDKSEVKYLKCRDEKGTAIVMSLKQTGDFIDAKPCEAVNGKLSVKPDALIENEKFPLVVRFIHGPRPRLTRFSGLVTLLDTFVETSLIGCVIENSKLTMIELPMDSPLTFRLALNDLTEKDKVKNALKLYDTRGSLFEKDIKYKFKFVQKVEKSFRETISSDHDQLGPSVSMRYRTGVNNTYFYL